MSRYIVTECPACTTRFQVTAGQLKLAGGKVRCGACLEVFNAEVYRCDDIPSAAESLSQPADTAAAAPPDTTDKDPLFEAIDIPAFVSHGHSDDDSQAATTDQAPEERLAEQLNSSPDTDFDNEELESPIQKLIEDAPAEPLDEPPSPEPSPQHTPSAAEQSTATVAEQGWTDPLAESVAQTLQQSAPPETAVAASVPDPEQTRPFTAIRAEPVMIRGTQSHRPMNWSATLLVLLAIVLFCGQFFWFNRQPLSTLPELAPLYQQACQHLPCELLPVIDLRQIDTRQLVVQEHTRYQGALSVSLLVENVASTPQPYPAVRLSFTDRKGKLISQRLFQPQEYLNNRQLDLQNMPARQTVQIRFDILDPGRRAVSYEARLETPRIAIQVTDNSWQRLLFGRFL